ILDNTPNWARNSQQWATSTQGGAELAAIQQFVAGLKQQANIGLMMFTNLGSKVDGAYVRFGVRDMSVQDNSLAFQSIVSSINPNQSDEKVCQNCGDYANALYETWLYFTGASASWAGMDPLADYAGNAGTKQDNLTASAKGLSIGFAYKGSSNGSGYNSPIGNGCAKSYVIFIGNNVRGGLPPTPGATDPASTTLTKYKYSSSPDVPSAWARFLQLRPDLGAGSAAAAIGSVTTYTIDTYNAQPNASFTAMMKNMARNGGGDYFQAGSQAAITTALNDILSRIQAVNSVFASVSLPVSVSVRGTYQNQVYLGMFRPDADARPNWVGNLKQYQLSADTSVSPPVVYLTDSLGAAVENKT
ncbi:MAG: hypothetical protein ACRER6_17155, partial [Pseudomonas sp.]